MNERTEVRGYVNTCPDDQMHKSVTHRCTACGKPFHKETADGGRATCSGHIVKEVYYGRPTVTRDSRHEPAPLRPIVR